MKSFGAAASSGGSAVLKPQRLFDDGHRHCIVLGHLCNGVASSKALHDDFGSDIGPGHNRATERARRVHHHAARLLVTRRCIAREREKQYRAAVPAEFDAGKRLCKVLPQGLLPLLRDVQQLTGMLDEQAYAVGQELLRGQWPWHAEPAPQEIDGLANLRQLDAMVAADDGQQMQLAQVDEGQFMPLRLRCLDDAQKALLRAIAAKVVVAKAPGVHRTDGQRKDACGLWHTVGRLVVDVRMGFGHGFPFSESAR